MAGSAAMVEICRREGTCSDIPAGLPQLGMVLRDREADLLADLKASRRRQKHELWRLVGILRWEDDAPVIQPSLEWRASRATQNKVPVEEVVLHRVRLKLRRRVRHLQRGGEWPRAGRQSGTGMARDGDRGQEGRLPAGCGEGRPVGAVPSS